MAYRVYLHIFIVLKNPTQKQYHIFCLPQPLVATHVCNTLRSIIKRRKLSSWLDINLINHRNN